jgi:hypothetical protein
MLYHLDTDTNKGPITNRQDLPLDKMWMWYIYLPCPRSEDQKSPFQSKQTKHFHQRNQFTYCEISSNKVKLPKVGSNAIVHVPVRVRAQQTLGRVQLVIQDPSRSLPSCLITYLLSHLQYISIECCA